MPDSAGDTSSESDVRSEDEIDNDEAITGSPGAYYEGDRSMRPATDDEGDVEVDGYQDDLSMRPATDDEGDVEVDGCQDDLSMRPATGDEDDVDGPADVYEEVIDAGPDLGRLANPDVDSRSPSPNPDSPSVPDIEELCGLVEDEDIQLNLEFIKAIRCSSLDNEGTGIDPEDLLRLRNPPTHELTLEHDPDVRLAIDLFLANYNNPIASFDKNREAFQRRYPENNTTYTLDQTKRLVRYLSGIVPLAHDMCLNTCIAPSAHWIAVHIATGLAMIPLYLEKATGERKPLSANFTQCRLARSFRHSIGARRVRRE